MVIVKVLQGERIFRASEATWPFVLVLMMNAGEPLSAELSLN